MGRPKLLGEIITQKAIDERRVFDTTRSQDVAEVRNYKPGLHKLMAFSAVGPAIVTAVERERIYAIDNVPVTHSSDTYLMFIEDLDKVCDTIKDGLNAAHSKDVYVIRGFYQMTSRGSTLKKSEFEFNKIGGREIKADYTETEKEKSNRGRKRKEKENDKSNAESKDQ